MLSNQAPLPRDIPNKDAQPLQLAIESAFLSPKAASVYNLEIGVISNFSSDITRDVLKDAIKRNSSEINSTEIVSDGILRLQRSMSQQDPLHCEIIVGVPGLGFLGKCLVEKSSGSITTFNCYTKPALALSILLESPSSIATDLIKCLDQGSRPESLPEAVRTVVEVTEDEGVLADSKGNGIIFGVNRNALEEGIRILGFRSNVQAIQTGNLDTCRILLGSGPTLGFALHSTAPSTFQVLASAIGEKLQLLSAHPSNISLSLISNHSLALEFGDPADRQTYREATQAFAEEHLDPTFRVRDINANYCCMHIALQRTVPRPIVLLPRR